MSLTSPLVGPHAATGRDTTLDVLRGCFILSMTIAHISLGSIAYRLTHVPWIDGAIGFVTLSGLVLGMVHRRAFDRTGRIAFSKVWRRGRLIYLISLGLVLAALGMRQLTDRPETMTHPEQFGGWLRSLGLAATLQMPAQNLNILPMYVVLFVLLVPALALLSAGRARALLAGSATLYTVGFLWPDRTVLPVLQQHAAAEFNWATWQLPFVLGLVGGWFFGERRIAARLRSRSGVLVAVGLAVTGFLLSVVFARLDVLDGHPLAQGVDRAFAKWDLGPGAIVYGLAAIASGYALVTRLSRARAARPVLAWLSLLGERSLDCFVILCAGVILFPAVLVYHQNEAPAVLLALLIVLVQTAWAAARRHRTERGARRPPLSTAAPADRREPRRSAVPSISGHNLSGHGTSGP